MMTKLDFGAQSISSQLGADRPFLSDLAGIGRTAIELGRSLEALSKRLTALEAEPIDDNLALLARRIYRARQQRARHIGENLLVEPCWDMLLDLFINTVAGTTISTTSLCIAGNVPLTTGLRWVQVLEERGLIQRAKAADDHRRTLVALSDVGYGAIQSCLIDWHRCVCLDFLN